MLRKKISQYGARNIQFRRNQEMNLILTQFSEIVDRLTQLFFISWSPGTDEMAAGKKLPVILPGREICQGVCAAYDIILIGRARFLVQDLELI